MTCPPRLVLLPSTILFFVSKWFSLLGYIVTCLRIFRTYTFNSVPRKTLVAHSNFRHHTRMRTHRYRKHLEPVRHAMKMGLDQSGEYKEMSEDELTRQASMERRNRGKKRDAMMDIVNVKDVVSDIKEHLLNGNDSGDEEEDDGGDDDGTAYKPPPRTESIEIDDAA